MSRKVILLSLVLGCCVLALIPGKSAPASDPAKGNTEEVRSFGPGCLVVYLQHTFGIESNSKSVTLKDAKLVKLGERYFVTGKGYVTKDLRDDPKWAWFDGIESGCAWDDVTDYFLMTEEQLEKREAATKSDE